MFYSNFPKLVLDAVIQVVQILLSTVQRSFEQEIMAHKLIELMQYITNNENDFLPTFLMKLYFLLSFFYFIFHF